jgi:hypothetical protein
MNRCVSFAQRDDKEKKSNTPIDLWGRRCLPLSPTFSTQPFGALQGAKVRSGAWRVNTGKIAGGLQRRWITSCRFARRKKLF